MSRLLYRRSNRAADLHTQARPGHGRSPAAPGTVAIIPRVRPARRPPAVRPVGSRRLPLDQSRRTRLLRIASGDSRSHRNAWLRHYPLQPWKGSTQARHQAGVGRSAPNPATTRVAGPVSTRPERRSCGAARSAGPATTTTSLVDQTPCDGTSNRGRSRSHDSAGYGRAAERCVPHHQRSPGSCGPRKLSRSPLRSLSLIRPVLPVADHPDREPRPLPCLLQCHQESVVSAVTIWVGSSSWLGRLSIGRRCQPLSRAL
jgi:hypothetical protein